MRLHVGCAMWTHRAWQPRSVPAAQRLRYYAERCNAVEGNTTFYATPARETVAAWAGQTSPDFRFVVKLPRHITHERRLAEADRPLRAFLDAIAPLGPRIDALWIQLPASFAPSDVPVLDRFLRHHPVAHRWAVEVRHPAFFAGPAAGRRLEETLLAAGAEWIPFDTTAFYRSPPTSDAERATWTAKPRVAVRTRALTDRPIVRYLGRDAVAETVAGWQPWLAVVASWLREGRSPTFFVHTPDDADALMLARRFHADVRQLVPELDPLPEPAPAPVDDEPLTLF
jgi:uncharacterized protein YecE (DUF72 family)